MLRSDDKDVMPWTDLGIIGKLQRDLPVDLTEDERLARADSLGLVYEEIEILTERHKEERARQKSEMTELTREQDRLVNIVRTRQEPRPVEVEFYGDYRGRKVYEVRADTRELLRVRRMTDEEHAAEGTVRRFQPVVHDGDRGVRGSPVLSGRDRAAGEREAEPYTTGDMTQALVAAVLKLRADHGSTSPGDRRIRMVAGKVVRWLEKEGKPLVIFARVEQMEREAIRGAQHAEMPDELDIEAWQAVRACMAEVVNGDGEEGEPDAEEREPVTAALRAVQRQHADAVIAPEETTEAVEGALAVLQEEGIVAAYLDAFDNERAGIGKPACVAWSRVREVLAPFASAADADAGTDARVLARLCWLIEDFPAGHGDIQGVASEFAHLTREHGAMHAYLHARSKQDDGGDPDPDVLRQIAWKYTAVEMMALVKPGPEERARHLLAGLAAAGTDAALQEAAGSALANLDSDGLLAASLDVSRILQSGPDPSTVAAWKQISDLLSPLVYEQSEREKSARLAANREAAADTASPDAPLRAKLENWTGPDVLAVDTGRYYVRIGVGEATADDVGVVSPWDVGVVKRLHTTMLRQLAHAVAPEQMEGWSNPPDRPQMIAFILGASADEFEPAPE